MSRQLLVDGAALEGVAPSLPRRILDIVLGGLSFIVLLPVVIAVMIAVKLTSPGPVLFRQERVGQGGRCFTLLKFRTMRVGAGGPDVTPADDKRLTPIGRWLRGAGFDELPQLLNIVRGDMTLVGPRPETMRLAEGYSATAATIFRYRPGLTGPGTIRLRDKDVLPAPEADVERFYAEVVVPQKVALDLGFERNPTFARTLKIIGETALYIVSGGRALRRTSVLGAPTEPVAAAEGETPVVHAPVAEQDAFGDVSPAGHADAL